MHDDYWIGDRVWIASLQKEGIYEGQDGDLAIIRIGEKKILRPFPDISILPEEEKDYLLEELQGESDQRHRYAFDFPDTLDLHISALNPKLENAEPAQILIHQRMRLREFLRSALEHRVKQVTIIHGKGEGVLRSEVMKVLSEFDEVRSVEQEPHGGSVIIKFVS